jgi:hypothetical protein
MSDQVNSGYFILVHVRSVNDWLDFVRSEYFILGQVTCDYVMIIEVRFGLFNSV